jgi:hypothetical protein
MVCAENGIRRPVVQIRGSGKEGLLPLRELVITAPVCKAVGDFRVRVQGRQ